MKRRGLFLALAAGLLVVVAAISLVPTYVLRGHLRGEVFYQGRPASYWRQALRSQDPAVSAEAVRQLHDGGESAVPVLVALLRGSAASGWEAAEARWKA